MSVKGRRINIKHGKYSRALVLPAQIEIGKESIFAGGRLLLIDPRGEINENDLLKFYEKFIAPKIYTHLILEHTKSEIE